MAASGCGGYEYSSHVYSDAGEFCVCRESSDAIGYTGLEYLGDLPRDGHIAGDDLNHVYLVRDQGLEAAKGDARK